MGAGLHHLSLNCLGVTGSFLDSCFHFSSVFRYISEAAWRETIAMWLKARGLGSSVPQRGNGAPDHCQGLLHKGAVKVGPLHDQGPDPDPDLEGVLGPGDTVQDTAQRLLLKKPGFL